MKPEEQIKALAELDGWTNIHDNKYGVPASGKTPPDWKGDGFSSASEDYILPNYLTSYDAIIPVIQKQPLEVRQRIAASGPISFMVTPAQLSEALLRATGKWKE